MPRASRSRLRCDPSSMRRTTDPGSPALTSATLPNLSQGPKSATKSLRAVLVRLLKWEDVRAYAQDKARGRPARGEMLAEKMTKKRYGRVQFRHVHVHLPLHPQEASETMVSRHRCIAMTASQRPRSPGSASHGDEWIDHARAFKAGASATGSLDRVQRGVVR